MAEENSKIRWLPLESNPEVSVLDFRIYELNTHPVQEGPLLASGRASGHDCYCAL